MDLTNSDFGIIFLPTNEEINSRLLSWMHVQKIGGIIVLMILTLLGAYILGFILGFTLAEIINRFKKGVKNDK